MKQIAIPFGALAFLACAEATPTFAPGIVGAGGAVPRDDPTTSNASAGGASMPLTDAGLPALTCTRCLWALKGARPDGALAETADSGRTLLDPCEGSGALWTAFWDSTCSGSCAEACPKLCTAPGGQFQPVGFNVPESWLWLNCIACVNGPGNSDPAAFLACKADG